jgi:hypothetical protein
MSQGTRKLWLDSRFRTSGTASNYEIDLGDQLDLGERPIAWITEATLVSSWPTIQEGRNNKLYVVEANSGTPPGGTVRVCPVTPGAYDAETLRVALEAALNTGRPAAQNAYTVTRSNSLGTTSTSSLGAAYRYYTVSCAVGSSFFIPTDEWLKQNYSAPGFDPLNPQSLNEIVSFQTTSLSQSHISSFVDLRGVHTAYIHMPGFTAYSTLAPGGRRTAVAKIPIDAAYGTVVSWEHPGAGHDFIDVGSQSIRTLSVELRDARGNFIDTMGAEWSFTIVFSQR